MGYYHLLVSRWPLTQNRLGSAAVVVPCVVRSAIILFCHVFTAGVQLPSPSALDAGLYVFSAVFMTLLLQLFGTLNRTEEAGKMSLL